MRALGRDVEAVDALERFLKDAVDAPVEKLREGQQQLQELRRRIAHIVVVSNLDGADVLIDGVRIGKTPLPRSVPVKPGPHQVVVQKSDLPTFTQAVDIAVGAEFRIEAHVTIPQADAKVPVLTEQPAAAAIGDRAPMGSTQDNTVVGRASTTGGHRTLGYVIGAVGVAGVVVGTVYGGIALKNYYDSTRLCKDTVCDNPAENDRRDLLIADTKHNRTVSMVAFAAGGAAVLIGGVGMSGRYAESVRARQRRQPRNRRFVREWRNRWRGRRRQWR